MLLDTPAFGTGHSLKISGSKPIEIKDVAIGEMWLCAGQSNMGWSTGNSAEAEFEANVNLPNYRIFKSSREPWHEPLKEKRDLLSQWKPCNPESAAETSVVAYNFGKKLHLSLNVPVGIIQQACAGTPIEGWMPWEVQQDNQPLQIGFGEQDSFTGRIREVRLYRRALTESEIQNLSRNSP